MLLNFSVIDEVPSSLVRVFAGSPPRGLVGPRLFLFWFIEVEECVGLEVLASDGKVLDWERELRFSDDEGLKNASLMASTNGLLSFISFMISAIGSGCCDVEGLLLGLLFSICFF